MRCDAYFVTTPLPANALTPTATRKRVPGPVRWERGLFPRNDKLFPKHDSEAVNLAWCREPLSQRTGRGAGVRALSELLDSLTIPSILRGLS